MNNIIQTNASRQFMSEERITDVLLQFDQNTSFRFNVILGSKTKDNERRFFHSETRYLAKKYSGMPELVSVTRMIKYYFSIEDTSHNDNWVMLGTQHVFLLKDLLWNKVVPWYPGFNNCAYEVQEGRLTIASTFELVNFDTHNGRSLGFEPVVLESFTGTTFPGIRMTINNTTYVDIGFELFMAFYYILEKTDMYSAACSILAYAKSAPYTINLYDMNNKVNDVLWQQPL